MHWLAVDLGTTGHKINKSFIWDQNNLQQVGNQLLQSLETFNLIHEKVRKLTKDNAERDSTVPELSITSIR